MAEKIVGIGIETEAGATGGTETGIETETEESGSLLGIITGENSYI